MHNEACRDASEIVMDEVSDVSEPSHLSLGIYTAQQQQSSLLL